MCRWTRVASGLVAAALVLGMASLPGCGADSPEALIVSGKELQVKGDLKSAIIQFKAALQRAPASPQVRFELGKALLEGGDPAGAAVELTKLMDQNYESDVVVPLLSRALLQSGQYQRLTTILGVKSLGDKQALAALKTDLATAWGIQGDLTKAEEADKAALATVPNFGPALLFKARIIATQGKIEEALALLDTIVAHDAKLAEAWQLKGDILLEARGDETGAESAYKQAIAVQPSYVPAHGALIHMRIRHADIAGAKAQADKLRATNPNDLQVLFADAELAYLGRNLGRARELVQQLMRSLPDHVGVLTLAGGVEADSGALIQAERLWGKALQLSPGFTVVRRNLAENYVRLGQPGRALEILQPLVNMPAPPVEFLGLAGDAAMRAGDAAAAEAYYLRAAKVDPGNPRIKAAVALSQMARGDAGNALSELQGLSAKATDTYADEALFSANMKRRDFEAALKALDSIDRKLPGKAETQEGRGSGLTTKMD